MLNFISVQCCNNSMMYLEGILPTCEWFTGMGGQWQNLKRLVLALVGSQLLLPL
jgi:hypothetical protein